MSWRWFKRFRLGGGLNANVTRSGVGWSWGIPGIRIGVSGSGRKWISFGIPGTGLYFYKAIGYVQRRRQDAELNDCGLEEPRNDAEPKPTLRWRNLK